MRMPRLLLVIVVMLMALGGCASLGGSDPLKVTLAGIESLPGQGMEVRIAVKLRVQNPNDAPVNFNGVALDLDLRGQSFASGVSDVAGTVPRFGETVLTVPVTVSAMALLRQALAFANSTTTRFDFLARGKLHDGSFGAARFESRGEFDLPSGLTGGTGATGALPRY